VPNLLAVLYVAIFPAVIALYFWNRAVSPSWAPTG